MRKKSQTQIITVPLIMFLVIFFIFVVGLLGVIMSKSWAVNDRAVRTDTMLYAILSNNDCDPNAKLPLRDILGLGIAQGKSNAGDTIALDYGGLSAPEQMKVSECFSNVLNRQLNLPPAYIFYVEYSVDSGNKYFEQTNSLLPGDLNVISSEYIALPDGNIARVVFKTKDVYKDAIKLN